MDSHHALLRITIQTSSRHRDHLGFFLETNPLRKRAV